MQAVQNLSSDSVYNLRLMKRFTLHITDIKPLCWYYTPHKVSEQFVQLLVDRDNVAHTL